MKRLLTAGALALLGLTQTGCVTVRLGWGLVCVSSAGGCDAEPKKP